MYSTILETVFVAIVSASSPYHHETNQYLYNNKIIGVNRNEGPQYHCIGVCCHSTSTTADQGFTTDAGV